MLRKKNPTDVPESAPESAAAPHKKPRQKSKKEPSAEPAAQVLTTPDPAAPKATTQSRRQTTKAKPKAPEAEIAPEQIEAPAPEKGPRRKVAASRRSRKSVEASAQPALPATIELDDEHGPIVVTFRPKSGLIVAEPKPPDRDKPVATLVAAEPLSIDSDDMPVIQWRTKGDAKTPETVSPDHARPAGADRDAGKTRGASGRRKKQPEGDSPEEAAAVEPAVAAPLPPKKPIIEIPPEGPRVILRGGVPALVRNHRVYPPIIFFGNPSDEKKEATVVEELRMAAEAGVHVHSFLVELPVDLAEVDNSAGLAGYLLSKTVAIDPEAQVIIRVVFQAARGWEHRYPNAVYEAASGETAEPSVCDDQFWGVAEECLKLFVRKLRLLDARDHVMGIHLERGEWFLPEGYGYDSSKAATHAFREWAKHRYLNDEVTLRASWFDGSVRFDTIQVPNFRPDGLEGERFIRSSRKQRRYVDYHLFLSDATVHRISELAYAAKSASEGMLLVGVSYGYTFEWSHPSSGHLALGKLLRTEEIDFIAGPPSYRNREPGGSAPFPCPIDSFALNGKLYLSEEDFKTSLSVGHEPDDFNPSLKTPQALESVHWRGTGAALAHASGVEWMDLWGNGWLRTHSVWERAAKVRQTLIDRMEAPLGDPDVAVFIDERALAYLVDSNAFALLVQNVRESVLRAGVSAAFYLLSDLAHREKFPESRLYLFLNAWDIRPELRAAIKSRLQRDDKVLFWLYSAGLFDAGRDSLERAREVTGIALKPQPFYSRAGTTILNRRHPLSEAFPDKSLIGGTKLEPSYFAIPEDGIVLGEYSQTGLPSFVVKEFREDPTATWTSVFLGEPLVNPALIRALAHMAGAHIWNYHEDVVHVRAPFCTIHCSGTGPRTITLPSKCSAYNLLTQDWAAVDSTNLRFVAIDGSTHLFLVGPRADLEHFMEANPDDVLHIDELPTRESNVRVDTSNFDVPIMKLDEWIEGGDQDEVADEWFLRPQQLIDENDLEPAQAAESPEQVGRRRRRRRRGKGGAFGERPAAGEIVTATATTSGSSSEEAFTMSVMFRKRE